MHKAPIVSDIRSSQDAKLQKSRQPVATSIWSSSFSTWAYCDVHGLEDSADFKGHSAPQHGQHFDAVARCTVLLGECALVVVACLLLLVDFV